MDRPRSFAYHAMIGAYHFPLRSGAAGVALSSWGPTLAAFGEDVSRLAEVTRDFLERLPQGGVCALTHANNSGAHVSVSDDVGQ